MSITAVRIIKQPSRGCTSIGEPDHKYSAMSLVLEGPDMQLEELRVRMPTVTEGALSVEGPRQKPYPAGPVGSYQQYYVIAPVNPVKRQHE